MKKLNFVEKLKVVWKHLKQGIAISPSFQGDPTIFHKEIFLKQTPHINLLPSLNLRVLASSHLVQTAKKKREGGWKREPQCATINYSPPKSPRSDVIFHFNFVRRGKACDYKTIWQGLLFGDSVRQKHS